MTNAMKKKVLKGINLCREINPNRYVLFYFRHYGENYRLIELYPNEFRLFRRSTTSIIDTLVDEFSLVGGEIK